MKTFWMFLLLLSVSVKALTTLDGPGGAYSGRSLDQGHDSEEHPAEAQTEAEEDASPDTADDHVETDHAVDEASDELDHAMENHEIDEALDEDDESQSEEESGEQSDVPHPVAMEGYMLDPYDPNDKLTKFYGISKALKKYEDSYILCFDQLPDPDFLQSELDKCTGKDFVHVHNALDYERRKLLAWTDKTMHKVMIEHCYEEAAEDEEASQACDLFKKDLLTLLWNSMPMKPLMEMHHIKYTRDRANMSPIIFSTLLEKVWDVEEEHDSLVEEVENHRESTIHQIQMYIKRRVDDIQDRFNRGEYNHYPKIKNDLIEWTERLIATPDYTLDMDGLTRKLVKQNGAQGTSKPTPGVRASSIPQTSGVRTARKGMKTRNFQKAFISDWRLSDGRRLVKERPTRPGSYDSGENEPLNMLERAQMQRERQKVDRFQFFKKH